MEIIIYEKPEGGLIVEYPAYSDLGRDGSETDLALIQRLISKTGDRLLLEYGEELPHHIIDAADIPEGVNLDDCHWDNGIVWDE